MGIHIVKFIIIQFEPKLTEHDQPGPRDVGHDQIEAEHSVPLNNTTTHCKGCHEEDQQNEESAHLSHYSEEDEYEYPGWFEYSHE